MPPNFTGPMIRSRAARRNLESEKDLAASLGRLPIMHSSVKSIRTCLVPKWLASWAALSIASMLKRAYCIYIKQKHTQRLFTQPKARACAGAAFKRGSSPGRFLITKACDVQGIPWRMAAWRRQPSRKASGHATGFQSEPSRRIPTATCEGRLPIESWADSAIRKYGNLCIFAYGKRRMERFLQGMPWFSRMATNRIPFLRTWNASPGRS